MVEMDTEIIPEPVQNSSFDKQFSNKKTLENPVGNMQYVEVKSSLPSPTDNTRLVVLPGWSITLETEKNLLKQLSTGVEEKKDQEGNIVTQLHYGRDIVSGEFPRFGGEVEGRKDIADEVVRQAELVNDLINTQEGKVDITGHSMAAMDIIAAIKLYPELLDKIRNIIITSPAGFFGDDNLLKLMGRFFNHSMQNTLSIMTSPIERRNLLKMDINSTFYIGKNLPRALKEANAIAMADEYEGLKELKQGFEEYGIMLGFIQAQSDKLTPAAKLWEIIGREAGDTKETDIYLRDKQDLRIQPTDTQEQRWEKTRRFVETKEEINRKIKDEEKTPPLDIITMIGGGHDNRIYGEEDFGVKLLRSFEELNRMRENGLKFVPKTV